ncbi:hypothetical protein CHARACLAT_030513, partial [Characodon lateralis]|nr:hypothetical protein [Characodon lateralis]
AGLGNLIDTMSSVVLQLFGLAFLTSVLLAEHGQLLSANHPPTPPAFPGNIVFQEEDTDLSNSASYRYAGSS